MDEDSQENQDNNKLNNQSIGTLEDASFVTTTNMHNEEIGQYLTVQVSIKLSQEESNLDNDIVFKDTASASTKFIIPWMKKDLIKGVCHNELKEVIDDICDFRSWVEDFRVVGRTTRYAQMYFKVFTLVS